MTMKDILNGGYPTSDSPILDPQALRAARGRASKAAKITPRALKAVADKSPAPVAIPEVFIVPTPISVATAADDTLKSTKHETDITETGPATAPTRSTRMATLTLKGLNKRGTQAIYSGLRTAVRFPISAFESKTAPQNIEVEGAFAAAKVARVKMTPEERKAANAARPKLTLAEKVARAEKRAAALKAKLAEQPSL